MKKLFGVMATIALMTCPVATAQPAHAQNQNHSQRQETRSAAHPTAPQRKAQRKVQQRQVQQRQVQQRQAVKRNARNAAAYNRTYADPRRYPNNGLHRGWAQDRGNAWRWRKGDRMGYNDWYYAPRVDYRQHRLRRPPYGYQWRRYEDRYALVAVSTGLILSVILSSGR